MTRWLARSFRRHRRPRAAGGAPLGAGRSRWRVTPASTASTCRPPPRRAPHQVRRCPARSRRRSPTSRSGRRSRSSTTGRTRTWSPAPTRRGASRDVAARCPRRGSPRPSTSRASTRSRARSTPGMVGAIVVGADSAAGLAPLTGRTRPRPPATTTAPAASDQPMDGGRRDRRDRRRGHRARGRVVRPRRAPPARGEGDQQLARRRAHERVDRDVVADAVRRDDVPAASPVVRALRSVNVSR